MPDSELPFSRKNWSLLAVGVATIVLGYALLRIPPVDGFLSLTLAPVMLVIGYCVLVPAAILVRDEPRTDPPDPRDGSRQD